MINQAIKTFEADVPLWGADPVDTGKAFLAQFLMGMDDDTVTSGSTLKSLADSLRAAGYDKYDAVDDFIRRIDPLGSRLEIPSLSII